MYINIHEHVPHWKLTIKHNLIRKEKIDLPLRLSIGVTLIHINTYTQTHLHKCVIIIVQKMRFYISTCIFYLFNELTIRNSFLYRFSVNELDEEKRYHDAQIFKVTINICKHKDMVKHIRSKLNRARMRCLGKHVLDIIWILFGS